jgi:hypothetical protein
MLVNCRGYVKGTEKAKKKGWIGGRRQRDQEVEEEEDNRDIYLWRILIWLMQVTLSEERVHRPCSSRVHGQVVRIAQRVMVHAMPM